MEMNLNFIFNEKDVPPKNIKLIKSASFSIYSNECQFIYGQTIKIWNVII